MAGVCLGWIPGMAAGERRGAQVGQGGGRLVEQVTMNGRLPRAQWSSSVGPLSPIWSLLGGPASEAEALDSVLAGWLLFQPLSVDPCSVTQSCPAFCDLMDCSTPGFSVVPCLPGFAQTHVH